MIFIDHPNVFHNLEKRKIRIDFVKLRRIITRKRRLKYSIIYMGLLKTIYPKKRAFLNYLKANMFFIKKCPVKMTHDGIKKQIGANVIIYKDMTELAEKNAYDTAILLSGSEGLVEVVNKLKELKKGIEIWSFKESLSHALIRAAGEENVFYIDEILNKIKRP